MFALLVGSLLIIAIMLDAFKTTLTTRGSGFLSGPFTFMVRRAIGVLHRIGGRRNILIHAGPLTLIMLVMLWLLILWAGWTLVFMGLENGIGNDQHQRPTLAGYIYYAGFTLSTLGIGDLMPQTNAARVLTSVAAFNGLILVTLVISYSIPIVNGVINRRKLAFSLALLGKNVTSLLINTWNHEDFRQLEQSLHQVGPEIIHCAENQLAYPVLDYFYTLEAEFSLGLQIAMLDEALTVLIAGINETQLPSSLTLQQSREILFLYISRSHEATHPTTANVPPLPTITSLATSGLPLKSQQIFEENMRDYDHRRCLLHKLVLHEGWKWSDITTQ